jgi:very-short-patch-repair endonuclease
VPSIFCKGRHRELGDIETIDSWAAKLNTGTPIEVLGRTNTEQTVYRRGCSRHFAFISAKAANSKKSRHAFLRCKYCHGKFVKKGKKKAVLMPSSHEQKALEVVEKVFQGSSIVTECYHLGKQVGAADFTVMLDSSTAGRKLVVEVDGSQHFSKGYNATSLKDQEDRDMRKDDAYWAAGMAVVRLHHNDSSWWEKKLLQAASLIRANPHDPFILYTAKYNKEDRRL